MPRQYFSRETAADSHTPSQSMAKPKLTKNYHLRPRPPDFHNFLYVIYTWSSVWPALYVWSILKAYCKNMTIDDTLGIIVFCRIDPSHKSHNALVLYPTIHYFVTEMCTFLLQSGALWDICLMHCGICLMNQLLWWKSSTVTLCGTVSSS